MPVLCKFAYELTLGLLHSCSPNVKKKKKGYRIAKPGLFFAFFFFFPNAIFLPLLSFVHVGKEVFWSS